MVIYDNNNKSSKKEPSFRLTHVRCSINISRRTLIIVVEQGIRFGYLIHISNLVQNMIIVGANS